MTLPSLVQRLFTAACCLLAASCFDCRDEFWIDAGGGGRAEIRVSLPAAALTLYGGQTGVAGIIENHFIANPELRLTDHRIAIDGNRANIALDVSFDSALDVARLANSPSAGSLPTAVARLAGEVEVAVRGRTVEFERRISPGKALPGAALMPDAAFEGRRLVSIVHLPAAARSHNATRTADSGRTLVWDVPLVHAVRSPLVSRFSVDMPVPWHFVSGIAFPVLLLAAWAMIHRRRKAALKSA